MGFLHLNDDLRWVSYGPFCILHKLFYFFLCQFQKIEFLVDGSIAFSYLLKYKINLGLWSHVSRNHQFRCYGSRLALYSQNSSLFYLPDVYQVFNKISWKTLLLPQQLNYLRVTLYGSQFFVNFYYFSEMVVEVHWKKQLKFCQNIRLIAFIDCFKNELLKVLCIFVKALVKSYFWEVSDNAD